MPDPWTIADELMKRGVKLHLGSIIHDPTDSMGKMFFNIPATFAEFESDLIRLRSRECMAVARTKGKLKVKKPKLSQTQSKKLRRMWALEVTRSVTWATCSGYRGRQSTGRRRGSLQPSDRGLILAPVQAQYLLRTASTTALS